MAGGESQTRAIRLMAAVDLLCVRQRKFIPTDSDHELPVSNLVDEMVLTEICLRLASPGYSVSYLRLPLCAWIFQRA